MKIFILLAYVTSYFIYAEDDYKTCYTDTYDVVIYGQFYCNGNGYQPSKVSLIEYSGYWVRSHVIQSKIFPLPKSRNKIYYFRKTQKTPKTEFSVSMEVTHSCNAYRGRPCQYTFIEHIPTSKIDCHGNERIAYTFHINLNSGNYRGRVSCTGPFGK
uniref:CPXV034 protein n=1 Tax=Parastrongyloides trichosuri TaxID=131310 RepID=A0A0N5A3K6_PARTI